MGSIHEIKENPNSRDTNSGNLMLVLLQPAVEQQNWDIRGEKEDPALHHRGPGGCRDSTGSKIKNI